MVTKKETDKVFNVLLAYLKKNSDDFFKGKKSISVSISFKDKEDFNKNSDNLGKLLESTLNDLFGEQNGKEKKEKTTEKAGSPKKSGSSNKKSGKRPRKKS